MPSGYATRRRWRETLGDDVGLRMSAARSPRAVGGASDVDCEERHTKRGRWSQSSPKVSRSRGPFGRGRGQHRLRGHVPQRIWRLKSRPRGHEYAALRGAVVDSPALSSVRQEDGCTGESVLPSNTDGVQRVGPRGPLRRIGRSYLVVSLIGRPVQCSAAD